MSKVPHFVYTARPTTRVRLKGLFEAGLLKEVLEKPQVLRANGWTMETQQEARIVKGEYLEIVLGDWKTIQLYEDGMLLAKVKADADFLAWGSRGDEGFEKHPRLNPLALIEFTYSFVDVFSRVLEHAEPQHIDCVLQVNIQHAIRVSGPLYLNPYGLETWAHKLDETRHTAPEDSAEIAVQMTAASIRANASRAAYQFVEKIYLWFGVPVDRIPYTMGAGDEKVIDVETLRRGGKQA
jgi:hypothetical protein